MEKSKSHITVLIGLILIIGLLGSYSCRKNRSMEAVITVKLMADTMVVIPNVRVEMTKDDVEIIGYTDDNGQFMHTFEQPVQLDIKAYNDTLSGIGVINISEYGRDYSKSIFIY